MLTALTYRLAWDLGPASTCAWLAGLLAVVGSSITSYSRHFVKIKSAVAGE